CIRRCGRHLACPTPSSSTNWCGWPSSATSADRPSVEGVDVSDLEVLLDHLVFPECPRWHDERLWFSDLYDHRVIAMTERAQTEVICDVPGQLGGLGWLPDGTLLVVSMLDRRLMRLDPDGLVARADLHDLTTFHLNDMVVDRFGRAYIGNFGFDVDAGDEPVGANMVCV